MRTEPSSNLLTPNPPSPKDSIDDKVDKQHYSFK